MNSVLNIKDCLVKLLVNQARMAVVIPEDGMGDWRGNSLSLTNVLIAVEMAFNNCRCSACELSCGDMPSSIGDQDQRPIIICDDCDKSLSWSEKELLIKKRYKEL